MTKATSTTVTSAKAGCHTCTFTANGKNAVALASQHHKNKRHRTWAEQTLRSEFGGSKAAGKSQGELL